MPHALACALFALWVSVCAFAPEAIWQGFLLLREHFGMAEGLTALFVGALLAFFVEPLLERLKAGRWRLHHPPPGGRALLTVPVALLFGAATVCVHEAMAAFLGSAHAHDGGARLSHAVGEALQWASVPAAVTVAWFAAARAPHFALLAAGLAAAWTVGTGYLFDWRPAVVVATVLPAFGIALLGARLTGRRWDEGTFPALARLTATVAAGWLVLLCLVRYAADALGWQMSRVYGTPQLLEDLRFYLGWSLGVMLAPDPIWRRITQEDLGVARVGDKRSSLHEAASPIDKQPS